MSWEHAEWLWMLFPVAAAAWWTLRRPVSVYQVVGDLEFWKPSGLRKAADSRPTRRVTWAWVFLLMGAVLAVLAEAGAQFSFSRPVRRVAVMVVPSAELKSDRLQAAVEPFTRRLEENDRVRLVLPYLAGGDQGWLRPNEMLSAMAGVKTWPLTAGEMTWPDWSDEATCSVAFLPAGARAEWPKPVYRVEVDANDPPVRIESAAAALLPDGQAQVFVRLAGEGEFRLRIGGLDERGEEVTLHEELLHVAGEWAGTFELPDWAVIAVEDGGGSGEGAYFTRWRRPVRSLAILGEDSPLLRRYARADSSWRLTDSESAEVVVCVGEVPPQGKPSLVIDPVKVSDGTAAEVSFNADLSEMHSDASDPVTRAVDWAGVGVRELHGWREVGPAYQVLARLEDRAVVLRSADGREPRQVILGFDPSASESTFARTDAAVIFLSNALNWLVETSGPSAAIEAYVSESPLRANIDPRSVCVLGAQKGFPLEENFPRRGVYRDPAGSFTAVSLLGIAPKIAPIDAARAVREIPLPPPRREGTVFSAWKAFAVLALCCWLCGWVLQRPSAGIQW